MSLDLSKLTSAPWIVRDSREGHDDYIDPQTGEVEPGACILSVSQEYVPRGVDEENGPNKWPMPVVCVDFEEGRFKEEPTDLAFIALARNAFDVMMRRGWHPVKNGNDWHVVVPGTSHGVVYKFWHDRAGCVDPFTALVVADEWYRENVEVAPTPPPCSGPAS